MQKLTQASSSTCEAGAVGRGSLAQPPPPTHHACTHTASPSGVPKHRATTRSPCPHTLAPPACPHRCCHMCAPGVCACKVRVPRDKCVVGDTWCETHFSAICVGL
eukprot:scaffold628_cov71-Phaeocystis_antarctica.AAC.6